MPETTFFNVWHTESKEKQQALVETMRQETSIFETAAGFLGLLIWTGEGEDYRVIAQGRWASDAAFQAAVANNLQAIEGRERMARLGRPEPGLFRPAIDLAPTEAAQAPAPRTTGDVAGLPAGFRERFAEVNGLRLHYVEGGTGPDLILLHGYPQTWYGWRKVMPLLADRFRLVVPDLRGLGESAPPADRDYTKKAVAADIHALARQLSIERAFVAGQDMGGPVGYALAADHPGFVRKLVLVDTGVPGFGLEAAMNPAAGGSWHFGFFAAADFPEMLTRGREKEFLTAFAFRSPFVFRQESVTDADVDRYLASYRTPEGMAAGLGYYRAFAQDAKDNLARPQGKLLIPVLAVGGDHGLGGFTLENVQRLADDASGVIIPGCGHFVYDEASEPLAHELATFFDE